MLRVCLQDISNQMVLADSVWKMEIGNETKDVIALRI